MGNHCIDLAFRHKARTPSPLTLWKNIKNPTSKTADTRILGESQSDSADSSCHCEGVGRTDKVIALYRLREGAKRLQAIHIYINILEMQNLNIDSCDLTSSSLAMTESAWITSLLNGFTMTKTGKSHKSKKPIESPIIVITIRLYYNAKYIHIKDSYGNDTTTSPH